MTTFGSRHLEILQHALGLDAYGQGSQYRNHFVTGPGSDDWIWCNDLAAAGLMEVRGGSELTGGDPCFIVTAKGKRFVAAVSPRPPRLTRSQRRYREYLDADSSLTFGEWLKWRSARRCPP